MGYRNLATHKLNLLKTNKIANNFSTCYVANATTLNHHNAIYSIKWFSLQLYLPLFHIRKQQNLRIFLMAWKLLGIWVQISLRYQKVCAIAFYEVLVTDLKKLYQLESNFWSEVENACSNISHVEIIMIAFYEDPFHTYYFSIKHHLTNLHSFYCE